MVLSTKDQVRAAATETRDEQPAPPAGEEKDAGWLAFWLFVFPLLLVVLLAALGIIRVV